MEENKNYTEPEENGNAASNPTDSAEAEAVDQKEPQTAVQAAPDKTEEKKLFDKKNGKLYATIFAGVAVVILVVVLLVVGGGNGETETTPVETTPEVTTPATTTPEATTPATTTPPSTPSETVTFPSDEDDDPKQEDVFFE